MSKEEKILLVKHEKGLLAGLWGLPAIEGSNPTEAKNNLLEAIDKDYRLKINKSGKLGEETHVFTHKTWKMVIYKIDIEEKATSYVREQSEYNGIEIAWLTKDEINNHVISTAFKKAQMEKGFLS